jgi:ketol-acid reductoisomerase
MIQTETVLNKKKAHAVATGGHKAGVLNSSFVAEVSDLMGEQTILCGMLQTGLSYVLIKWSKKD